ncbi:hypothetical protein BDZ97DRAFT_588504 [Flammula alnicola]|nr:hypothetical protein BDZ97DRAFT_588504 [Flammula alnicola]
MKTRRYLVRSISWNFTLGFVLGWARIIPDIPHQPLTRFQNDDGNRFSCGRGTSCGGKESGDTQGTLKLRADDFEGKCDRELKWRHNSVIDSSLAALTRYILVSAADFPAQSSHQTCGDVSII